MAHFKVLFFFISAAVIENSVCSFADFFSRISLGPLEGTLGPSFPADTVYQKFKTCRNHFMLTRAAGGTVEASSLGRCRAAAAEKGAHAFTFRSGVCELAALRYPLCLSRDKNFQLYILPAFLSNGTDTDGALLTPNVVSEILGTTQHRSFRIEAPTILDTRGFSRNLGNFPASDNAHTENFILLRDNGAPVAVSKNILADPLCYTNSTCGVPFFTSSVEDEGLRQQTFILHDVCSQRLVIRPGQVYYLMSHAFIGCEHFPDEYPVLPCSVLFRGFGELKATMTLVDFPGDDSCGGHHLNVITFDEHSSRKRNSRRVNLCKNPVQEITTQKGRVRISLSNVDRVKRKKYGFIIKISY